MKAYDLYVPVADNDGERFSHDTLDAIETDLIGLFGGFTQHPECVGVWWDDFVLYRDPIRIYTIFTSDRNQVIDVAAGLCRSLAQRFISVVTPDRSALLVDAAGIVKIA